MNRVTSLAPADETAAAWRKLGIPTVVLRVYGPAQGLPDIKFGTSPKDLYEKAQWDRWAVISIKNN